MNEERIDFQFHIGDVKKAVQDLLFEFFAQQNQNDRLSSNKSSPKVIDLDSFNGP